MAQLERGALAGVTYFDTWTAQTLETPGKVGKHPVATMTFVRAQKLSNGATSKAEVVISPDVPGGTVRWTSTLELNGQAQTSAHRLDGDGAEELLLPDDADRVIGVFGLRHAQMNDEQRRI